MPQKNSSTNLWGYNSGSIATQSNKIKVIYDKQEITSIV
jgi:hypothetical protein